MVCTEIKVGGSTEIKESHAKGAESVNKERKKKKKKNKNKKGKKGKRNKITPMIDEAPESGIYISVRSPALQLNISFVAFNLF